MYLLYIFTWKIIGMCKFFYPISIVDKYRFVESLKIFIFK